MSARSWKRPVPQPWSPEEEKQLQDACRAGLSCDYWKTVFPDRTFGDVAEKRLTMREQGLIIYPRPI